MGGSHKSFWMGGDSNHRPSGPEAEILPLCYSAIVSYLVTKNVMFILETQKYVVQWTSLELNCSENNVSKSFKIIFTTW